MLWLIKNKAEVYYCSLLCIDLVHIYGGPMTAMNAILAIIADSGRSIDCHRQRGRRKIISRLVY